MSRIIRCLRTTGKYLLLTPAVIAVMALLLLGTGIGSATANTVDNKPKNAHDAYKIRDPKVDPNMSPQHRARIQRDVQVKKRSDTRKFIEGVMAGKIQAAGKEGGAK